MMPLRIRRNPMLLLPLLVALSCATHRRALPIAQPEQLGLSAAALAGIAPALRAYVDSGKLAGIYAVIARYGRTGYEQSIGWSDIERRVPMKRDAIFRIFSMTKPVVAAGVLKLVDQGKLSLDDPVAKFIPAFEQIRVFDGGTADQPTLRAPDSVMTVRHLLTHTGGLAYGLTRSPVDTIFRQARMYDAARSIEEFSDSLARLPLLFSPGSNWSYSSGIDVAGRVIEVASGKALDDFLESELFQPLGMLDTSFRIRRGYGDRLTTLYMRGPDGRLQQVTGGLMAMYEPDARFLWGSGGLLSTPDDFLRFAQMLLNGGELNGVRVLSHASVAELMRDQLPPAMSPLNRPPMIDRGYSQGLGGIVLVDSAQAELPGGAGIYRWSGYVGTYFWIDPANQLIGMVWTQFSPGGAFPLEDQFQRLVYGALNP